jgi:hypothetical protein
MVRADARIMIVSEKSYPPSFPAVAGLVRDQLFYNFDSVNLQRTVPFKA